MSEFSKPRIRIPRIRTPFLCLASMLVGVVAGIAGGSWTGIATLHAESVVPTEHSGLSVETLGVVPADSMEAQIGLSGHVLQLRAITVAPGGTIAQHSHETRPGLVWMSDGVLTEGRESGETEYGVGGAVLVEDRDTVHWFWNRTDAPATAIVCDIVPAS